MQQDKAYLSQPGTATVINQTQLQTKVEIEEPQALQSKQSHFIFGIIRIVLGSLMFIVAYALTWSATLLGNEFFCGVLVLISGIVNLVAAKNDNHYVLIACMVLNIVASLLFIITGIITSNIERLQ